MFVWYVTASIQHLALLSIERYIAVKYPYNYHEMVTERRLTAAVVFAGSVAALLTVLTAILTVKNAFTVFFSQFRCSNQYFHSGLLPNFCLL